MSDVMQPRHAPRRSRRARIALPIGLAVTALGALWSLAEASAVVPEATPPVPVAVLELPAVEVEATVASDPCADPAVQAALAGGDDNAVVVAFGGGIAFRDAVVAGNAPCVSLGDSARAWVVVNKTLSLVPEDYAPAPLAGTALAATSRSVELRTDAATSINAMATALNSSGSGVLGMNNGYRSHALQVRTYSGQVTALGQAAADQLSARPGFSEHQTGLALDVVSCSGRCGSIDTFGGTPESDWVAAHAWEYGFIVRYEEGATGTTGYVPEPWHLRYIGVELATAYHNGGYHTLEEFFGLPAAPDYVH